MTLRARWLIGVMLLACQLGTAYALEIGLLLSRAAGVDREVAEAIKRFADHDATGQSIKLIGSVEHEIDPELMERAELVIAIGVGATQHMAQRADKPTLAVLISRQQFATAHSSHPDANLSAIVLDHPPERQIALARAILPDLRRIGIIAGPDGAAMAQSYREPAAAERIDLQIRNIFDNNELLPALEPLLQTSDMMLVLPDPMTAQSGVIRSILLSSYRQRRPILAYSQGYVDAGALAALFSTPSDIGRDVAAWLAQHPARIGPTGEIVTPTHFRIAINRRVARTLSLDIPDDQILQSRILSEGAP